MERAWLEGDARVRGYGAFCVAGFFPDPISTVRICTEEIQCEMRHRCSRGEKRPVPKRPGRPKVPHRPTRGGRLGHWGWVGGGGVTTVIRHCIYVPNIKVAFKGVSTFLF